MIKRLLSLFVFLTVSVAASAQYKLASVDHMLGPEFELKYFLEAENSTIVYGTMTSSKSVGFYLARELAVIKNDIKYKIKNSVNLPLYDESEKMEAVFSGPGEKVNFVLEFEKFPLEGKFDIVEKADPKEGGTYLNIYGIQLEPIELSQFPDFDQFLDSYPPVLRGHYVDNGSNVYFFMRNDVYISCRCTYMEGGLFEPNYYRFLVEINNDSDHGILFDFDQVYVMGHNTVRGNVQDKPFVKYTPDSFEAYMAEDDYYEAKGAVGGMKDVGSRLRSASYNNSNGEWANLGLKVLGDLADGIAEQNIREYLKTHPKNRPGVLRSQSLKSGDSIGGYMAFKKQKAENFTLHIPIDGYDFTFLWK